MRADEKVLASEVLRAVLDREPLGVCVYEPADHDDFVHVYVNHAFQELKPFRPMLGRTYSEVWPELAGFAIPRFFDVLDTGLPWVETNLPLEVETEPGVTETHYFTYEISRLEVEGRPLVLDTAREVTAEVRASLALEASQERLRQELETSALLLRAANALAESLDLGQSLDVVARVLLDAVGHRRTWVFLWDEAKREAFLAASAGTAALPTGTTFAFDALSLETKRVVTEKRMQVVDYDALPPDRRGPAENLGSHLALLVPLVQKGQLVGLVGFDDPGERRGFDRREIEIAEGMAAQAAIGIENARLFEAEQETARLNAALNATNDVIHSTRDFGELMKRATDEGKAAFGSEAVGVLLKEGDRWAFRFASGAPAEKFVGSTLTEEQLTSLTLEPIRTMRPLVQSDVSRIAKTSEVVRRSGVKSVLNVPMVSEGKAFGVVSFQYFEKATAFTDRQVDFATKFAASLMLAIENARLFEAQRRSARFAQSMVQINADLASSLDIDATLPRVLETAADELGGSGAAVADRVEGGWRLREVVGLVAAGVERGALFPDEKAPRLMRMLAERQPQYVDDVRTAMEVNRDAADRIGVRAYATYPLIVRNEISGALTIDFSEPRVLSDEERDYLRRVAFAISLSEENSRLYKAEKQAREREERLRATSDRLNEIQRVLASTLEFDEVIRRVAAEATDLVGADAAAVAVFEGDRLRFRAGYGLPDALFEAVIDTREGRFHRMVRDSGQPQVSVDTYEDDRVDQEFVRQFGLRSILAAPFSVRGSLFGILAFYRLTKPAPFDDEKIDVARKIAAMTGLATENARLYESEHGIAETLQEALLTVPDQVPGIEFAHAYRSAAEVARVGGDFYDVFEMGHDLVGITIGDVAGKGLNASVLTSLVKSTIRAHATEKGDAPARILGLTNEIVFEETQAESFVTVFFGVLSRRDGRLVYGSAGHTTGVITAGDGAITMLPATGPVLGAFSGMEFDETERHLDLDASLFLYTDGLTEARRDQELFGEARVFELGARLAGEEPADLVGGVIEEVLRFAGGQLNDDLALLAVKRLKSGVPTSRPQKVEMRQQGAYGDE